jgi:DNA mismatch endonuclease (patch repair protein)
MNIPTSAEKSAMMSRVKSRGNLSTEIALLKIFQDFKITGWRRNSTIFGSPDFIFPKSKIAVFVDGCFWHSCPKHKTAPATNVEFWENKLRRNRKRDLTVNRELSALGWRVVRIWQHSLKNRKRVAARVITLVSQSAEK